MKFVANFMSIKIYQQSYIGKKSGGKQQIEIKFEIVQKRKKSNKNLSVPNLLPFHDQKSVNKLEGNRSEHPLQYSVCTMYLRFIQKFRPPFFKHSV